MLRKSLLLVVLSSALVFMGAAIKADEIPADSIARYLKSDTFLYLEIRDLESTIERAKGLAVTKMFQNPEIQVFLESLSSIARDEAGDQNEFESGLALIKKAIQSFSGNFSLSIPAVSKENSIPQLIVTSGYSPENKTSIEDFFNGLKDLIFEKKQVALVESVEEVDGYQAHVFKLRVEDPSEKSVCYILTGKHAILTIGLETLKTFIANMKTPPQDTLASNPSFVKIYNSVHTLDMFWYYDNKQYMELTSDMIEAAIPFPALRSLFGRFKNFTSVSGTGVSIDGEDFVEETLTLYSDPNTPIARAIANCRTELKTASLMPQECLLYMSFGIPSDNLGELLMSVLGEDKLPENITSFENDMMLSIRDDILPAFGGEIGMYMSMQFLMPEFMAAIELRKPEVISQALTGLDMLIPGSVTESEFRGNKIYTLASQGMPGMQLALAIRENYLLIGLISAVKSSFVREENLTQNETFTDARKITDGRKTSGYFYLDVKSLVGFVYDNAMPFLQSLLAQAPQFDPTTIPSRNALVEFLRPVAASFDYIKDGSFSYTRGFACISLVSLGQIILNSMKITSEINIPGDDAPPDLF